MGSGLAKVFGALRDYAVMEKKTMQTTMSWKGKLAIPDQLLFRRIFGWAINKQMKARQVLDDPAMPVLYRGRSFRGSRPIGGILTFTAV